MNQKLWFKAKRYGWGWYPSTWQGWLVLLAHFFVLITSAYVFLPHISAEVATQQNLIYFFVMVFFSTALLIWICYKKGEEPRWRWGDKSK